MYIKLNCIKCFSIMSQSQLNNTPLIYNWYNSLTQMFGVRFKKKKKKTKLHLFDQTVKTVTLWNINKKNCFLLNLNFIYSCDGKAEFSPALLKSLILSVTWSFRNHYMMLIYWSKLLFIIINVENSCAVFLCDFDLSWTYWPQTFEQ